MINWETLISSFDDPLTLLQWLIKLVEEQEAQKVNNITLEYADDEYYRIVLNYSDGVQVKSPLIPKGEKYTLTLQDLQSKIEGSDIISFDINEQGTKLIISLDKTHVDDVVTEDSENLITSGAVYDAISGITGDSKLVEVTYGVTTYNEVKAIVDSGKIPYCIYNSNYYYCGFYTTNQTMYFYANDYGSTSTSLYVIIISPQNVWSLATRTNELVANKETTLTSSSTTKYPSSKAVADYVAQHSGGGWTQLWVNASPSSTFASQTLTLDTTNYSKLAITLYQGATIIIDKSNTVSKLTDYEYDDGASISYHRPITTVSNAKLVFAACKGTTITDSGSISSATKNGSCKPYKIYGFN